MTGRSPLTTLNNGVEMPALGLGVYQSSPEETAAAAETAIANGYRLIDTAAAYLNERQVGEGIGIRRSGIARSEMFVTTKLWISDYGYERALRAFDASQRRLGLDYVDLYLLHWPVPSDFEATVASYRATEKLLADGRVRAIGVCNHKVTHLENLIAHRCGAGGESGRAAPVLHLARGACGRRASRCRHAVVVAARGRERVLAS